MSQISLITSVKTNWFNSEKYFSAHESVKITALTVENILFTFESVKMQITVSISENLTDSDLESSNLRTDHDILKSFPGFYPEVKQGTK